MIKFEELLPAESFAYLGTTGEIVLIKKGEKGYYPQPISVTFGRTVDELNEILGVTKAQGEAMKSGSMFGWHVPASNPQFWEKEAQEKGERIYNHNELPSHLK